MLYKAYKLGPRNFEAIRDSMLQEPIFQFDYYLKSIKPNQLGKRVQSLIQVLKDKELSAYSSRSNSFEEFSPISKTNKNESNLKNIEKNKQKVERIREIRGSDINDSIEVVSKN